MLLKLTQRYAGTPVIVNSDKIVAMYPLPPDTFVNVHGETVSYPEGTNIDCSVGVIGPETLSVLEPISNILKRL